jgi:superfamily I DNA/RNA helicase
MADDRQEAEFIANEIAQRQVTEGAPWTEFAVLFRMNAQARLLEQHLRSLRIPYRVIGGKSFFDRREVKDLLAYAACLLNCDDDVALLRIINTPARGISETTVERATKLSSRMQTSVWKALQSEELRGELAPRALTAVEKFFALMDGFETRLHEPLAVQSTVLRELIAAVGYREDLRRTCRTPEEALSRETNIDELIRSFEEYESRSSEGLRGFLDEMLLRFDREEEDEGEQGFGVTLITLHAAKGLEFPHVYLIGLEEGILPHDRSKAEGTVDEERRLLYVGITRARETLALSWCRHRMKYGSASPCTVSSFVRELPAGWIEHRDAAQILNAPVVRASAESRFAALKATLSRE